MWRKPWGMTFQKTMNKAAILSPNAISYSCRQLAQRAGIEDCRSVNGELSFQGVPFYYQHPEEVNHEGKKIIVIPCRMTDWQELLEKPANSIDWLSPDALFPPGAQPLFEYSIPVIFWGESNERRKIAECRSDGTLIFYVDIVATVFFMLSRREETNQQLHDEHGRFPAFASVAHKQGFLDLPVADLYGLILREWFRLVMPGWDPSRSHLRINITHDIDWVYQFSSVLQFARMAGSALLRRWDLKELMGHFRSLYVQMAAPQQDEFYRSIYKLAEISEACQLSSRFYFMAAEAGSYQQGYNPSSSLMRQCLHDLQDRGHEIGFHPGYDTLDDPTRLMVEKQRLENAFGGRVSGGRQHYLRFHVPQTWRDWEQAGLLYDSTMGFADFEGFRCGTCHPYHPFDIELDREMKILEIPLIVMDASLLHYRNLSSQEGRERILQLARRCSDVGGIFTLLWHNTSFSGRWMQWERMYREVLSELSSMAALRDDLRTDGK
jgi:hypothetical protein